MEMNKLYRHKNNKDVALCPLNHSVGILEGKKFHVYKAAWFNIVQCRVSGKDPIHIVTEKRVMIEDTSLENWEFFSEVPKGVLLF